jgi:hypothetical protein
MNETFTRTTTKQRDMALKAPSWMLDNSESVSNEIDESESQNESYDKQRF